ncbi:MAG TPA: 50S ribosomal protein L22 [Verrucomicrobiae bacterium]|nr:50S ribosomal protein L22 [Verrucomicrobiae bacterium]
MIEIQHTTRSIRVAPRKMRLVVDKVRHLPAKDAMALLPLIPKRGAIHIQKSLKAAIEAAKDKNLNPDTLVIQRIYADEGTALKRIISRSRGRATGIMKKYSHLTIVLKGEEGSSARAPKRRVQATPTEDAQVAEEEK